MPLAYFPVVELGRRVRRFSTSSQESMAEMNAFLHETFSGNKIVKAFGMEAYEKKAFAGKNHAVFRFDIKSIRAKALTSPVMEAFGGVGISLVLWYGGFAVIRGAQTPGDFLSFMTAVMLLYPPIKKLTKLNNVLQQGLAASDRVFDILETDSDILDPETPEKLAFGAHRIQFKDVSFSYDGRERVLKNIDLDVRPGEIIALVGMSGGGKTSLVNLIPRFFDVTDGSIQIDGADIRDFTVADLRQQVAIVTQEPILFNKSIRDNIAYGKPAASEEEIIHAAKAAYIYNFIETLPRGFDTVIGELGSRLSGGEKQRMCIARGPFEKCPDSDSGRSHGLSGYRVGAARAEGPGKSDERPDLFCDCPSALHHILRQPHCGDCGRPDRGRRGARSASCPERGILHALSDAVRGKRGGERQGPGAIRVMSCGKV